MNSLYKKKKKKKKKKTTCSVQHSYCANCLDFAYQQLLDAKNPPSLKIDNMILAT
jgi:hypothetical protein